MKPFRLVYFSGYFFLTQLRNFLNFSPDSVVPFVFIVICAPTSCYEILLFFFLFAPTQNMVVTDHIQRVAEEFHCKPIEGMLSHQLKQHVIDGEKCIIQNPTEAQRYKDYEQRRTVTIPG